MGRNASTRRVAKFVNSLQVAQLALVHKHRQKRGLVVGPDAALDLVRASLSAGWAEGEVLAVLEERLHVYEACRHSEVEQHAEYRRCFDGSRAGLERFFRIWLWTFDPRLKKGKVRPFVLFPKQVEYLDWLETRYDKQEDAVVEKSRDQGFSWLSCMWSLFRWLSEPGFTAFFISNLERNVDQLGNAKSLLEKIRICLRLLPTWMLPAGFLPNRHLATKLRIINPANGSAIIGEGGKNAGRAGRASIVFIDEAAHVEKADELEQSLSQTADCRIWGSTPKGMGNLFYRKVTAPGSIVFRFHWKDDPRKNHFYLRVGRDGTKYEFYPWYEKQKRIHSPLTVAQEIDISYVGSVEGVVFPPLWLEACIGLALPRSDYKSAGLDVGEEIAETALAIRAGPVVYMLRAWNQLNPVPSARRVKRICAEEGVQHLSYDAQGVGAGTTGELVSGRSGGARANRLPFRVNPVRWGGKPSKLRWPNKKRSDEMFADNKAEQFWIVRERMRKTFEYVLWLKGDPDGIQHPVDELLSIPDDAVLIRQAPTVFFEEGSDGKIRIESKKHLKKRGIQSPDRLEAVVYSFAPEKIEQKTVDSASISTWT